MMSDSCSGVDDVMDGVVVAALELADGDDHVEFPNAEAGERCCF
jgi:hypothetical protein